jgi:hypothetical protein
VSGTATSGADFQPLSGSVTIPAGSSDAVVAVVPIDDALYEVLESVVVNVTATEAYTLGSPSSATVTVTSDDLPPDLVVSVFSIPVNVAAGSTIDVQDTTKNQGAGSAPESRTGFYLSLNTAWDVSDQFLGERIVPPLPSGGLASATTPLDLPAAMAPGTYYVIAKADWNGVIDEQSNTNNTRSDSAKAGPDLTVSTLTAPATATPGETFSVTDTTKNLGAGTAGASTTSFYLSANTTFDGGDVPLGSRPVGQVAGLGSDVATTTLTIPLSIAGAIGLREHVVRRGPFGDRAHRAGDRWPGAADRGERHDQQPGHRRSTAHRDALLLVGQHHARYLRHADRHPPGRRG